MYLVVPREWHESSVAVELVDDTVVVGVLTATINIGVMLDEEIVIPWRQVRRVERS